MYRATMIATALALGAGGAIAAQETQPPWVPPPDSTAIEQIRRVLRLPQTTQRAREQGIPDSAVRDILILTRQRGLPAEDAQRAVETETDAVAGGAPKGEFGAFVHSQLDRGLRGQDLAKAIRAEHERRKAAMHEGHGPGVEGTAAKGAAKAEEAAGRGKGKADSVKGKGKKQ